MTPDREQIVYALERQIRALDAQADALARARDYSAEFPAEDADRLRECVRLLTTVVAPSYAPLARQHRRDQAQGVSSSGSVGGSTSQQADAWWMVCKALDKVRPGWNRERESGADSAVAAIEALAGAPKSSNAMSEVRPATTPEAIKESISLGEFCNDGEVFRVWLEIDGGCREGPVLCWRSTRGTAGYPLNGVFLSGLLEVAVLPKPLDLSDPPAHMPGADRAKFVAAALAALRRPFKGAFQIVWVPDDGLPF